MDGTTEIPVPEKTPAIPATPKEVCTIHVMFPVDGIDKAAAVYDVIKTATEKLADVVMDFRVSDARIAPRRIQPNG